MREVLANRFTEVLVFRSGLLDYCSVQYEGSDQLVGRVYIIVRPKEEKDLEEIERIMLVILRALRDEGASDVEITRYQQNKKKLSLDCFESCTGIATLLERRFFPERDVMSVFDIHEANNDEVMALVRDYFTPEKKFTLRLIPLSPDEKKAWYQKQEEEDLLVQERLDKTKRTTEIDEVNCSDAIPSVTLAPFVFPHPDEKLVLSNGLTVYLKKRDVQPMMSGVLCFKQDELFTLALEQANKKFLKRFAMEMLGSGTIHEYYSDIATFFREHYAEYSFTEQLGYFNCYEESFEAIAKKFTSMLAYPVYGQEPLNQRIEGVKNILGILIYWMIFVLLEMILLRFISSILIPLIWCLFWWVTLTWIRLKLLLKELLVLGKILKSVCRSLRRCLRFQK